MTIDKKKLAADRRLVWIHYAMLPTLNGYAEVFSVFAGEPAHIRLARKPGLNLFAMFKTFTVEAIALRNVVTGAETAVPPPKGVAIKREKPKNYRDEGADYAARVEIATDALEPGLYECVIRDSWGTASKDIYFNVKPARYRDYDLACVLPTFTWQAYNRLAGGSFYSDDLGPVRTITTQRPINRTGDNTINAAIPFLRAFAEAGARIVCIDSWDLHHAAVPGGRPPVMALLTHDEYWSQPMRIAVDRYVKSGGVLMVMAGNVCWWKITVEGTNLTVDKTQESYQRRRETQSQGHQWFQQGEPEERTFIASFRFGGYAVERAAKKPELRKLTDRVDASLLRNSGSLKIERPDHPIFQGVALDPGNRLGEEVPVVYREIDAVPLTAEGKVDRTWYDADKIEPEILATGTVVRNRLFNVPVDQAGIVVEADVAKGHVLHMGTFGWSRGLSQGNARVKRVVQNAYRYCRQLARERLGR